MIIVAALYLAIEVIPSFKLVNGVYYNCYHNGDICQGTEK